MRAVRIVHAFENRLTLVLLVAGLVLLSTVPVYSVAGKPCKPTFTVTLSPTSQTVQRGSGVRFSATNSGDVCLRDTMVYSRASIFPSANGLIVSVTPCCGYPFYAGEGVAVGASAGTPVGTYTVTVTVTGQQAPLVGVSASASATVTVT